MTMTQVKNLLYALICIVVAVGGETGLLQIFPAGWRHYVTSAVIIAMWIKSHWNLFINPNGTPAAVAWDPRDAKAGK